MKNLISPCPKELVAVIREAYPGYWPLTREQICYFLFRKVEAGRSAPTSFLDGIDSPFPYNTYLRTFLGLGLDDPPFLTGNRKSIHYTESDFGGQGVDTYLELWVDDAALAEIRALPFQVVQGDTYL
jgi:hypothetical protein